MFNSLRKKWKNVTSLGGDFLLTHTVHLQSADKTPAKLTASTLPGPHRVSVTAAERSTDLWVKTASDSWEELCWREPAAAAARWQRERSRANQTWSLTRWLPSEDCLMPRWNLTRSSDGPDHLVAPAAISRHGNQVWLITISWLSGVIYLFHHHQSSYLSSL